MAPLVKEKSEATNSAVDSLASQSSPSGKTTDHLSSDAVSLEVPIKIHGSRVTESVRGATPQTEPFEEQTSTMIVFPQGGVLRMSTQVAAGQMLVLTNLKTRQDSICRVVKVRTYSNAASYVEVEFTHPQPGYWGVYFSSDGPELAKKSEVPSPFQTASLESEQKPGGNGAPPDSAAPAASAPSATSSSPFPEVKEPSPLRPAAAPVNKNQSSFISIGAQEDVQLSATPTQFSRGPKAAGRVPQPPSPSNSIQLESAGSIAEPGESENAGDNLFTAEGTTAVREKVAANAAHSAQNSSATFGEVFGKSSARADSREKLGGDLDSGVALATSRPQNWKLVAGGVTLGIVLAGGAFFLFRPSTNANNAAKPASAPVAAVQPEATPSQPSQPAVLPTASSHSAAASVSSTSPVSSKSALVAESKKSPEVAALPVARSAKPVDTPEPAAEPAAAAPTVAAEKRTVPDVTSDLFGALNAHPVAGRTPSRGQTQAPVLDVVPQAPSGANGSLPVISSPSAAQIPVPTQSSAGAALEVGGGVPEPKLLSSTLPVYPAAARETRTEGSVVIRATIGTNGTVADAQVVSGPALLRMAAVDAVKHWKYAPSKVNGKPVAVQTLITIHFRF